VQRLESDRRAVQIMTVHKAKGLEAAVVFLAGGFSASRNDSVRVYHEGGRRMAWVGALDDPHVETLVKQEEREEEQRLMYVALTRAKGRLYLPCAVDDGSAANGRRRSGDPKILRGPYELVHRRVAEALRSGAPWLSVEDVAAPPPPGGAPVAVEPTARWEPPLSLLHGSRGGTDHAYLRRRAEGVRVTSYTRMSEIVAKRTIDAGRSPPLPGAAASPDGEAPTLRAARASGVFLHELLERVPLPSFLASEGFAAWRRRVDVACLFVEAVRAHRIERSQCEHAELLVWNAYTTPATLPGGARLQGFASASRAVREMDFAFAVSREGTEVVVRGSLDLVFEHEGLTYFVDWKSDTLRSYSPDLLGSHVHANYEDQGALYTLAIVKLLGIGTAEEYAARFGGLLYCFLRGFDAPGGGLWTARPTWEQVRASEQALENEVST
jgi:exodeoxyribonuclease V beta subunit